MAVLIDMPLWERHGTRWAHLVSDASLDELHEFAERAGLSTRAFDRDHYDVSAGSIPQLIALGAQQVSPKDLVRRLLASGLRIKQRDRR